MSKSESRNYFSYWLSIFTSCIILIFPQTIISQSIGETIITTEKEQHVFENKNQEFSVTVFEDGKLKSRYVEDPDSIMNVIVVFYEPPAKVQNKNSGINNINLSFTQNIKSAHEIFKSDLNQIIQSIKNSGVDILPAQVTHEYIHAINGMALQTTRRVVDQLYTHPMVASIHPDGEVKALINESAKFVGADSVRTKYNVTGKGVLVGVIDDGLNYMHPALGGGIGEGYRVLGGYDFADNDNDPMDEYGHGTWVSGIIGGNGDSLTGMAPEVNFLAVRVLNASGYGLNSDLIAGIEYCMDPDGDPSTDDGVDIINMSLGDSEGDANDPMSIAVNNAFANGILCVVAAGNEGYGSETISPFNTISSPGSAKTALTVGASDLNDKITWFSSKGPAPGSFGIKPEIVAPGFEITSAGLDNGYMTASGTSASSPVVAGAAALLMEHNPDWDNIQVKAALINSAKRLSSVESPYIQGNGRLDVVKSFEQSVLISPSVVSFGVVDLAVDVWQTQDTLIVNNPTDSVITLNLFPPEWISGITFNLSKNNFTLNPEESDSLIVSIQVSKDVPFLNEEPFSYYGNIICIAGSDTFTVPCGFTKTRQLIIESSIGSRMIIVWSEDSPEVHIISRKSKVSIPIKAGNYRVLSVMKTTSSDSYYHIYLVEEKNVIVENLTYLYMDHNKVTFNSPLKYYGKDGNELDPEYFQSARFGITAYLENISVGMEFSGNVMNFIHSVPLDENYTMAHSRIHHVIDPAGPITLMHKYKQRIESDEDLSFNDGSDGLKRFYIKLPEQETTLSGGLLFRNTYFHKSGISSHTNGMSIGGNYIKGPIDIAFEESKLNNDPFYTTRAIGYWDEVDLQAIYPTRNSSMFFSPNYYVTSEGELVTYLKEISFGNTSKHIARLGTYSEGDTLNFPIISSEVLIPDLSTHWNESLVAFFNNDMFATASIHSMRGFWEAEPFGSDSIFNNIFYSSLFGDGMLKDKFNSATTERDYLHSETITNEFQIDLQTSPYEILGQYGNSSLFHHGNVNNYYEGSLSLFHFDVRSGDKISKWVSVGESNRISFLIRNSDINLSSIKVILINEFAEEREIEAVNVEGIQYSANIPDDLTSGFYGVHLIATDQYQEPLEFIADPAFYFGPKDAAPIPHANLSVENYYPIDSTYFTIQPDTIDLLTVDIRNIGVETASNIKLNIENSESIGIYIANSVEIIEIDPDSINQVQIPIHTTFNLPIDSLVRVNLIAEWESIGNQYKRRFYLTFGTAKRPTSVHDINHSIVKDFVLYQNYPNPFNPSSKIGFNIPKSGEVKLNVYNVLGELVTELVNEYLEAGFYQYEFNGSNLTSGVYFYKIQFGSFADIKKMLFLK